MGEGGGNGKCFFSGSQDVAKYQQPVKVRRRTLGQLLQGEVASRRSRRTPIWNCRRRRDKDNNGSFTILNANRRSGGLIVLESLGKRTENSIRVVSQKALPQLVKLSLVTRVRTLIVQDDLRHLSTRDRLRRRLGLGTGRSMETTYTG